VTSRLKTVNEIARVVLTFFPFYPTAVSFTYVYRYWVHKMYRVAQKTKCGTLFDTPYNFVKY